VSLIFGTRFASGLAPGQASRWCTSLELGRYGRRSTLPGGPSLKLAESGSRTRP